MSHAPTLEEVLREAVCYDEEEEGWLCEIPGEEDLWARGRTREEALEGLASCIREWLEEEGRDEEVDIQPLQEPWTPGLFGISWRWILIPSLLLVSLLVTLVVLADHPPQYGLERSVPQAETPVPTATFRSQQPSLPAPTIQVAPVESPQGERYQELEQMREMEQSLHQLETRLDLCSDPDTGSFARAIFCH